MMRWLATSISLSVLAGGAGADTAYVKPSSFAPELNQTITIEVGFNDYCCEPRYPVLSNSFAVIDSSQAFSQPDRIESFITFTVLEHKIAREGTTRITTGERLGRLGEYVLLDGTYHMVNSQDANALNIPDGTPILTSQTATVTDAYVSVGTPDWHAIRAQVGRLRIEPAVHPNLITVGLPVVARVTFDQEPVADQRIIVTTEAQRLRGEKGFESKTDANGIFNVTIDDPGAAIIMTRLQAPSPDGAKTDIRSYTTALTLDVGT